jgi:outer membrane protein assembly factor BamB
MFGAAAAIVGALAVGPSSAAAQVPAPPGAPNPVDLVPHVAPAPLTAGEWPFYGHDVANSRDGGSAGPSVTKVLGLRPVWSVQSTDGDFTGTPVEAGGTVVAVSGGGTVFAIDASTGALRWSRDLDQPANASAAIADGRVYVPLATTSAPAIAALSLADGAPLWTTVLDASQGASAYGSPVVWNETVYGGVAVAGGYVFAVTGTQGDSGYVVGYRAP